MLNADSSSRLEFYGWRLACTNRRSRGAQHGSVYIRHEIATGVATRKQRNDIRGTTKPQQESTTTTAIVRLQRPRIGQVGVWPPIDWSVCI